MSAERPFLDTNVLIYATSAGDPRQATAVKLLLTGGFISVQVVNEFVNVCRRKRQMRWEAILDALRFFRALLPVPRAIDFETHLNALSIATERGYSIYDSLIIASAQEAGCNVLYSEDLQHGQAIGGLTICNPFR
jgi:predicted nucleic acid-binding protein